MVSQLAGMFPADRTEMQRRVLAHDWAASALGPESYWPATLRQVVGLALTTRFPMLVMWGPDLVMVYNDGYAEMLGDRHPAALGAPLAEVWSDVWPVIGPMLDHVRVSGEATHSKDLHLVMGRSGFDEETYFTFSYSPVHDPDGSVVGLIDIAVETTSQVLADRRLRTLQRLGGLPRAEHASAAQACASALAVLGEASADVPFAAAYLVGEDGEAALVAEFGATDDTRPTTGQVQDVIAGSQAATLSGEDGHASAVLAPLIVAGQARAVGAILLGVSPHLRLDEEYRTFLTLAADQVAAGVSDARAVELEEARSGFFAEVAVTLQRSVLGPTNLPAGFGVHYAPATAALEVGGDWYDVVDLPGGRHGVVVGDVVGRGVAAAAVMGQLRSAARALLLESRSPAQVLSALDHFAALVPGASCSTVFCAVLDPAARRMRYSSAGHPPAILVTAEGVQQLLDGAGGLPLAVDDDASRPDAEDELPEGATLLLYTDGLVESRRTPIDDGIQRAADVLAEGRRLPPAELTELLARRLLGDDRDDDIAFLLFSCCPEPPGPAAR